MANHHTFARGSKARFRISMLLLVALLLAKLFWPVRRSTGSADQPIAQSGEANNRFRPVGDENAQVWGLAGSLLNLFSGGYRSPAQRHSEWEQEEADRRLQEQADNKRH
ncbi:hypothetical protein HNV11_18720 [Spirosoma taeanense]|uniref:Uncharacterized protein n=1 Tax=Spirosoma taeanense TaxID=2735870 RepID=A0A6M5YDA5_9BACT|nr:hypothetical protein [Spirosoma taeanense]QJW91263.1 hypothetical protein HNV11_18720 [Spirosoma taeanense]